jgi:hypothetical protein
MKTVHAHQNDRNSMKQRRVWWHREKGLNRMNSPLTFIVLLK